MASNVSNLLKEKIVTPVANSVAAQVDNKVKNGIILRKFIGVQLGESNTGCQLVKIDLNKINVKDPSYEFTLYIKAFSQKGLFNFIVNVNKTDSLQVDVKCEVKNSDSNNGEAIGYYDVDAVGNTITISLLKAFVVNTSINECKFVSTKDTLNISDLDIDWSDTGNVKNDTSIDIKGKESNIEIDVDKYLNIDCGTLGENQRYRIATIDYSKLSEAKYFDGTSGSSTGNSIGCFVRIKIASNLMGMMILEFRPLLLSRIDLSSARVILESKGMLTFSIDSDRGNIGAFLYKRENKSIQIFYNNDLFSTTSKDTIHVFSCEIISLNAKLDPDTIKVTFDMDTTIVTDTLNEIDLENDMNLYKVFTTDVNSMGGPSFNGLVPGPNKNEADNKYLLGADAKWHPRKAGNEYIANLKPTEEIKGLSETDTTKGISFVTFDFNTLSQKVVEAAPSTMQEFMIVMKVLTYDLGIITISTKLKVTKAGIIVCNAVLSDRGMGSNSVSFSTSYSGKLGAVTTPGFFVNDYDTKIFKIALYTPIAIDGVKIIDVVVTSYSDIIDESDITFTWELGILEKKPIQLFRSNIIYPRIDLDRELVFDQMNIETPISETDEDTLFAEQIKHNGLVPAPGKYEVNNGYYLKADGSWDLPKRQVQDAIATVTPTSEMISQVEAAKTTKLISFLTIDVTDVVSTIEKTERFTFSMNVLTINFGLVRIGFTIIINTRGDSNISNFNSDLGTDMLPVQLTRIYNLKDYGVETMSPIFGISDSSNKGIFNIGINGSSMKGKVIVLNISCIPSQTTLEYKPFKYIFEPTLIDLDSSTTIRRVNSSLIGSMDPSNVFGPITEITSEEIANETDPYELKMKKLRKNGLVPAPYQYEVDNQYFLKADGSWDLPKNSINDYIALVTPSGEMADQTGTTTGVSFVTIDYSKAYEKLSLGTNETTGFRVYLTIFNETYGKLEIALRTIIVNLGENINQGVTAYADIGTESGGLSLQLVQIQNNYGEDIRTPIFTDIDPTTYKIRVGIYAVGINKPVIVKNCTIHQTHDTIDTHDIDIVWEANVVTFSEENTKSASQYTNINLNKTFTPIINMRDPEGSYSDSQVRRWRLENNGFVPAPAKYEADQGRVLCADGTWSSANDIMTSITTNPEDEGKILKAHNGSVIWATLINGEEVGY